MILIQAHSARGHKIGKQIGNHLKLFITRNFSAKLHSSGDADIVIVEFCSPKDEYEWLELSL